MSNKKLYKPNAISGFPEWLPEIRFIEQQWMDKIRRVFESYGFCNIETPSVEELDVLTAKGDVDKEIYTLTRLHADEKDKSDARLALHFDQTVPFARYVAQNFNDLTFPFKRYQMQRVWRGERPQEGRFREFYQCDIDVIHVDNLPIHFDAEMPAIVHEILTSLDIGDFEIRLNNRKILNGYLEVIGVKDIVSAIRLLDKFDKIGHDGVKKQLVEDLGLSEEKAEQALALATIKTPDDSFVEKVLALLPEGLLESDVPHTGIPYSDAPYTDHLEHDAATLREGLDELKFVMQQLPQANIIADLSIARGFDYYTGTVYETLFIDAPEYGSICSGGRYDDLASSYINKKLPGVGISIGFTRLFSKLLKDGRFQNAPSSPADVMVTLPSEEQRPYVMEICKTLRDRGFKVDMYHSATKMKKQIAYADKKGIPFIWLFDFDNPKSQSVKNMKTGEQLPADASDWTGK